MRSTNTCTTWTVTRPLYVAVQRVTGVRGPLTVWQVTPKFVNSLVELITSSIDGIASTDFHPASRAPPGLIDGVQTPDMISRHFRNTLYYIQAKKAALANPVTADRPNPKWDEVDVVGACLKMSIAVNGAA